MHKQKRRDFIKLLGAGIGVSMLPGCSTKAKSKPNFVFILIDDMGWADTGCYGSTFYETPNIDKLATQGMRFTHAYAAGSVCSPTRASILSGKHPARVEITDWIGSKAKGKLLPPIDRDEMPFEEVTIAEALKKAGYATGFIGKWHLGADPYLPENQGFDINIGGDEYGAPPSYFYPYKGRNRKVPDLGDGKPDEYLTDRLTDESLTFIEQHQDEPFFLYLSHYAVHTPLQSKPDLLEKYKAKAEKLPSLDPAFLPEGNGRSLTRARQDNPVFAGMVESTDKSVGRVMQKLKELDLEKNTIVIFMSDNGGLSTLLKSRRTWPTCNLPLRAGKGWLYEGGIREPLIIKWPDVVKPDTECDEVVTSTDFYPTILQMAGLDLMPEQHKDGVSMMPLLKQTGTIDRKAIYWHYPHYHGSGNVPSGAVRAGDYKLIEWYEDGSVELYDLSKDIGEKTNLVDEMPEKTKQLKEMLHNWRNQINAKMPLPNPDWQGG
jgi:arylsulfatase A-like enzyme